MLDALKDASVGSEVGRRLDDEVDFGGGAAEGFGLGFEVGALLVSFGDNHTMSGELGGSV